MQKTSDKIRSKIVRMISLQTEVQDLLEGIVKEGFQPTAEDISVLAELEMRLSDTIALAEKMGLQLEVQ